ncbi:allene oxide synthase-lipoxygenase protein-like [Centruroides sculpturatus]|uniref:allene oxide synthase-lipoxygenase protein-like n=1 Tax=Centruroides sculpturatus TaxID=218467 RepID=UPI000C6EF8A1|nr:allene oxide synthase-lipoxygenase protein-like [Centruroides sculpturatus]
MGQWYSSFTISDHKQLLIHVVTGDRKGAGTDANVWLVLHDDRNNRSTITKLNRRFRNDNERGSINTFTAYPGNNFGKAIKIELWRDSFGIGDSWYLQMINVEDPETGEISHFPVHRWIKADHQYVLMKYDCCLPQKHDCVHQRKMELREKRNLYCFHQHIDCGPSQVRCLPEDEKFSHDYKWDIVKNKTKLLLHTKVINWTTEKWRSMENLKKVYKFSLGEPNGMIYWNEDIWFGLQRIQGVNPVLIQLCKEIPSKFPLENHMVEPFLETMTLQEAIEKKRIYIIDLEILQGISCRNSRIICSPIALFYLNKDNDLLPIAIQLFQDPKPDNPVSIFNLFLYTFSLFLLLGSTYELFITCSKKIQVLKLLGIGHAAANFQQYDEYAFPPNYPSLLTGEPPKDKRPLEEKDILNQIPNKEITLDVMVITKLLSSKGTNSLGDFEIQYLYDPVSVKAAEDRGLSKLISVNGWVDKTMTIGRDGMFQLIIKGLDRWRMDVDGILPNNFKIREVDNPDTFPNYPYRDDALAMWYAIKRYVTKVVHHFYEDEDSIIEDYELQEWREELVKERCSGGVGIKGVPGDENGKFTNYEHVILTISSIISTCSIGHAAANFQQYDEYAFPPNYPSLLTGEPPKDKRPLEEKDILNQIPNKEITLDVMVITKLLSSKGTNSLGDFEIQYLYDPVSVKAAEE